MYNQIRKIFLLVMVLINTVALFSQSNYNHSYPRTAIFHWTGASPDYYARHDLCMTRYFEKSMIDRVKAINPDVIWLPSRDFNCANGDWPHECEEWYLRDSNGNRITVYSSYTHFPDLSDHAIPNANGEYFRDVYPAYLKELVDACGADGVSSDGLWAGVHLHYNKFPGNDVDMDRNGVNDYTEHGNDWVKNHWVTGVEMFLQSLRNTLGDDAIIMINVTHNDWGGAEHMNGHVRENCVNENYFSWYVTDWNRNKSKFRQPMISMRHNWPPTDDPLIVYPTKNDYASMRSGLCRATLLDQYFTYEEDFHNGHYWNKYYDEFDLDIGFPKGDIIKFNVTANDHAAWVRFYDSGVVILNMTGQNLTITDNDIAQFAGYDGPYYRFQGGQDPAFNNGEQFTSVTLPSVIYNGTWVRGDGIILVDAPQTVITDIIIDNVDSGTSPGSLPVTLTNGWGDIDCSGGREYYSARCSSHRESWSFATVSPGSNQTATFRPTIGVAGSYEVFEYHPYIGGAPSTFVEATNVPVTIRHGNGTTTTTINQSVNFGQWNSLGVYDFPTGTTSYVQFNNNANGPVIADAIKFVYRGVPGEMDVDPPAAPQGVDVTTP